MAGGRESKELKMKTIGIRIDEKTYQQIEDLKKSEKFAYMHTTSEMIRYLISTGITFENYCNDNKRNDIKC